MTFAKFAQSKKRPTVIGFSHSEKRPTKRQTRVLRNYNSQERRCSFRPCAYHTGDSDIVLHPVGGMFVLHAVHNRRGLNTRTTSFVLLHFGVYIYALESSLLVETFISQQVHLEVRLTCLRFHYILATYESFEVTNLVSVRWSISSGYGI